MSLKSQTWDPQLKVPPRGFLRPEKNQSTSVGFEPLDLETSTVPRDHQGLLLLSKCQRVICFQQPAESK
jgi:hypothetical protein